MYLFTKVGLLAAAIGLLVPASAFCTAVTVNGGCQVGNCSSVDTLAADAYQDGSFSTLYTFPNGDKFDVAGHFGATNSSTTGFDLNANVTAIYMGNTLPTTLSQADVLSISFLQNFAAIGPLSNYDGYYDEDTDSTVLGGAGSGTTFQAQLSINGNGLGVMGPFGDGVNHGTGEVFLSGLTDPITTDYQFIYTFGAGSDAGSTVSSLVLPEPSYGIVTGLGLALFGFCKFCRLRTRLSENER